MLNEIRDRPHATTLTEPPLRWISVTTQEFTDKGRKGFWMFMLSPFAIGASWSVGVFTQKPDIALVAWLIFLVAAIVNVLGIVWMLIGRRMTTTSEPAKPLTFSMTDRPLWG